MRRRRRFCTRFGLVSGVGRSDGNNTVSLAPQGNKAASTLVKLMHYAGAVLRTIVPCLPTLHKVS